MIIGLLAWLFPELKGQENLYISSSYSDTSFNSFVHKVKNDLGVRIFYDPQGVSDINLSFSADSVLLLDLLEARLKSVDIYLSTDRSGNIFLTNDTLMQTRLPGDFFNFQIEKDAKEKFIDTAGSNYLETTDQYVAKTLLVGDKRKGVNKSIVTLSGYAKNSKTGEAIMGATILEQSTAKGTVTDINGYYSMELKKGEHILTIRSVNLKEKQIKVDMLSDGELDLILEDKIVMLPDVVINAEVNNKVKGTQMGMEKIKVKNVKKIPLVFGEKDIFKVALLLPGVQTVGEGSSGFNVRGSPVDQNIFYINRVPVYNTSHVAGFFSAFNSDAVSEFSLYKSNIPIHYGGRLSSVFEIDAREGSKEKLIAAGGISPVTARLMIGAPLKKKKSSFLIGARSTYSDWVLDFVKDHNIKNSSASFADLVANFSLELRNNNHINIFSYFSTDNMDLATQTKYNYQNIGGSITWKRYFKLDNSFELSLSHSGYSFEEENSQFLLDSYKHHNRLDHTEIKTLVSLRPDDKHVFSFGLNSILYQIDKGNYNPLNPESLIVTTDLGEEKGLENALFFSDEWKLLPRLTTNTGVRFNTFTSMGPQRVIKYKDGLPKVTETITDTLFYSDFEPIRTYAGLDFRFGANYLLNDRMSLKLGYNRMHQYIFMLSNTIAIAPDYRWKLCDYNIKPIVGDQVSIGWFTNFLNGKFAFSIETYYKNSRNVVEIKDGADLLMNATTEQITLQGNMNAYGVEITLQKPIGDLNGWVNYTFSRSRVKVDSEYDENKINFGESYPSNYDKPHAFNLVLNYSFTRRINLSGNIVYSTGRPITYPTSIYYQDEIPTLNYSARNEYRIPDYFRVDMAVSIEGSLRKYKLWHGSWIFSVYNLFGRDNVYSVYFVQEKNQVKAYSMSIFGVPIFSVSYNIKLGNYASE